MIQTSLDLVPKSAEECLVDDSTKSTSIIEITPCAKKIMSH